MEKNHEFSLFNSMLHTNLPISYWTNFYVKDNIVYYEIKIFKPLAEINHHLTNLVLDFKQNFLNNLSHFKQELSTLLVSDNNQFKESGLDLNYDNNTLTILLDFDANSIKTYLTTNKAYLLSIFDNIHFDFKLKYNNVLKQDTLIHPLNKPPFSTLFQPQKHSIILSPSKTEAKKLIMNKTSIFDFITHQQAKKDIPQPIIFDIDNDGIKTNHDAPKIIKSDLAQADMLYLVNNFTYALNLREENGYSVFNLKELIHLSHYLETTHHILSDKFNALSDEFIIDYVLNLLYYKNHNFIYFSQNDFINQLKNLKDHTKLSQDIDAILNCDLYLNLNLQTLFKMLKTLNSEFELLLQEYYFKINMLQENTFDLELKLYYSILYLLIYLIKDSEFINVAINQQQIIAVNVIYDLSLAYKKSFIIDNDKLDADLKVKFIDVFNLNLIATSNLIATKKQLSNALNLKVNTDLVVNEVYFQVFSHHLKVFNDVLSHLNIKAFNPNNEFETIIVNKVSEIYDLYPNQKIQIYSNANNKMLLNLKLENKELKFIKVYVKNPNEVLIIIIYPNILN